MKEYISIGKNIDVAIENGLKFLGRNREDVDIKVLETGGLFKKAKVCLIYEDIILNEEQVAEQEVEIQKTQQENISIENNVEQNNITNVEEVEENLEEDVEANKNAEQVEQTETVKGDINSLKDRVTEFLITFAQKFNTQIEVNSEIVDNSINLSISGEKVGKLIGYRGETLNALQNLLGGLKQPGEGKFRIYLDIENYKKNREQTLIELANKMADKAEEIERNVHLDPMNPYERRVIHSALQNRELVETESMGEGEKRHVVIKFKR